MTHKTHPIQPVLLRALAFCLCAAAFAACGGSGSQDPLSANSSTPPGNIRFSIAGFTNGSGIPPESTCQGADVSPPLQWAGAPTQTKAFAVVMNDLDAGLFTHWVLYDVPFSATQLARGLPNDESLPDGSKQGKNDFGKNGYGGPCPPAGSEHHYRFRLYALDAPLRLAGGRSESEVSDAMRGHILAYGELTGRFSR